MLSSTADFGWAGLGAYFFSAFFFKASRRPVFLSLAPVSAAGAQAAAGLGAGAGAGAAGFLVSSFGFSSTAPIFFWCSFSCSAKTCFSILARSVFAISSRSCFSFASTSASTYYFSAFSDLIAPSRASCYSVMRKAIRPFSIEACFASALATLILFSRSAYNYFIPAIFFVMVALPSFFSSTLLASIVFLTYSSVILRAFTRFLTSSNLAAF